MHPISTAGPDSILEGPLVGYHGQDSPIKDGNAPVSTILPCNRAIIPPGKVFRELERMLYLLIWTPQNSTEQASTACWPGRAGCSLIRAVLPSCPASNDCTAGLLVASLGKLDQVRAH